MIGDVLLAATPDGLPQAPEDRFQVLTQPGMPDQSVLYEVPRWQPIELGFWITAPTYEAIITLVAKLRAQRRKKVIVSDGLQSIKDTLVITFRFGVPHNDGIIIGGLLPADRWSLDGTAILLPPASSL
jgi:hypothetical protein